MASDAPFAGTVVLVRDPRTPPRLEASCEIPPAGEPDGWLRRMREAPLLIVCLAHEAAYADRYAAPDKDDVTARDRRPSAPFWVVDTGMAALLMLQTAVDCGLGACFFGVPAARVASLRHAFAIPRGRSPTSRRS